MRISPLALRFPAVVALLLALGACSDAAEIDLPNQAPTEDGWIELAALAPPPVAETSPVYLFVRGEDGIVDWATSPADGPIRLSGDTTATPVDVIAFVPERADWRADGPFERGAYAVFRNVAETPTTLIFDQWVLADDDESVTDARELPPLVGVEGSVADPDGRPLPGALVTTAEGHWAYADGEGNFALANVPQSETTVSVAAPGVEGTLNLDPASDTPLAVSTTSQATPSTPVTMSGTVIDATTGTPVANVDVIRNEIVVATTDAQGAYSFQTDPGLQGLAFRADAGFSMDYRLVMCAPGPSCVHDAKIQPLEPLMFGEWHYCSSRNAVDGSPLALDDPDNGIVFEHVRHPQTFREDGTATDYYGESRWASIPLTRTESWLVGQPTPAYGGTHIPISTENGSYRFGTIGTEIVMVNFGSNVIAEHIYAQAGSPLGCDGDATTPASKYGELTFMGQTIPFRESPILYACGDVFSHALQSEPFDGGVIDLRFFGPPAQGVSSPLQPSASDCTTPRGAITVCHGADESLCPDPYTDVIHLEGTYGAAAETVPHPDYADEVAYRFEIDATFEHPSTGETVEVSGYYIGTYEW